MFKFEYVNEMSYMYDAAHKGAPYTMDGGKSWKNAGEWKESICKAHRGLDYMVNPATSWCDGSDIESEHASVKSSGASLACLYGFDFQNILDTYFQNVASTIWYWVEVHDETVIEYHMDSTEFRAFLEAWAKLEKVAGGQYKVRMKKTSGKMLDWLDERCG